MSYDVKMDLLNEEQVDCIASKVGGAVRYLSNGSISKTRFNAKKAPRKTKEWFDAIPEDGYLVKIHDEYGFLYNHKEYHIGQLKGTKGQLKAMIHGKRTSESVVCLLKEVAVELNKEEIGCEAFVGEHAGMNYEHVLNVFIKEEYEAIEVSRIIDKTKQVIDELTVAKWNSLVDLVDLR